MDYTAQVRRIDLNLRAEYPYLQTKIYQTEPYKYFIYIKTKPIDDFNKLDSEFKSKIKFMGTPVCITQDEPMEKTKIITQITDDEIASDGAGIPLRHFDIVNLVIERFPDCGLVSVIEDHNLNTIEVSVNFLQNEVQQFLEKVGCNYRYIVIKTDKKPPQISIPENSSMNILAPKLMKSDFKFLEEQTDYYYENIDKVYSSELRKFDLPFLKKDDFSCYIDLSIFPNINLRNHLFLYDTIYLSLPLIGKQDLLFKDQKINKKEFLNLIEKGRIKILNTQSEIRLDQSLLKGIQEANPNALTSRRMISLAYIAELVEINKNYIFNNPELLSSIVPISKVLESAFNLPEGTVTNFILWPIRALRKSYESLQFSGTKGICQFGVNNILDTFFSNKLGKDLSFEFTVNAESIHLASALDATYFPFKKDSRGYSDGPFANVMGNLLNFYKNATEDKLSYFIAQENIKSLNKPLLSPLDVFEVNEYISLTELDDHFFSKKRREIMRTLFHNLSKKSAQHREEEIVAYNKRVNDLIKEKVASNFGKLILTETAGLKIPFLSVIASMLGVLAKKGADKFDPIKNIKIAFDNKKLDDQNNSPIHMLSIVDRVVRLKQDYS